MVLIVAGFAALDLLLLKQTYLRPEYVAGEIESLVGRPVRLGDIRLSANGITASGFEVPGHDRLDFLKADRIRISLDRGKLLDGQVAIADIDLDGPQVRLEIDREGRCELLDLISEVVGRIGKKGQAKGGAIPKIHVRGGTLVFRHQTLMKGEASLTVKNVTADILPYGPDEFVVDGSVDAGELGIWKIEGRIDTATGRNEIRFSTRGLVLGPHSVAAFGEEVQRAYEMYKAAGPVDASVLFVNNAGEEKPLRLVADVTARGIEITYGNFPYRVVGVEGLIRLKDDGIEFQNMSAKMWVDAEGRETTTPQRGQEPATITMSGMTDGYDKVAAYKLYFDIDHLPVNTKLRNALQPSTQNVYDMFSPTGSVEGKVNVIREHGLGLPVIHNVKMNLVACTATFKPFPYPVTDATGEVELLGDRLFIRNARAQHNGAWFTVNGELTSIEPEGGIKVTVDATGVPLDPAAKQALPPAVRQIWEHFDPVGAIDLHWVTTRPVGPDKELEYDVTIRPQGMKARYDGVPYPLTDVSGEVWTNAKEVRITRLQGKHGPANVGIRGTVSQLDTVPAYDLTIDAEEVPIDGELRAALPDDFADLMTDINLKGVVKVEKLNFKKGGPDLEEGHVQYTSAGISLFEASFDAGLEYRKAVAELASINGFITEKEHTLSGRIRTGTLLIEDFRIKNLTGNVRLAGGELFLQDLESTCYDGRLKGSVNLNLESKEFVVEMKATEIDLLQLTLDTTMAGKNITGKVDAEMRIDGTGSDSNRFGGHGELVLKDSELWQVPLFVGIFTKLQLGRQDPFESGYVRFDIGRGRLKVKSGTMHSKSLDLEAEKGSWMDFDGRLGLLLSPSFKDRKWFALPLKLIDQLLEGTMGIRVSGTFKNPDTSLAPKLDIMRMIGIGGSDEDDGHK